ncbi:MAG: DNA repair protein RecN [Clostridiales bacterium]|nr:DNA repair protein RecN [Candidatus Crickella caballi]
MLNQIIVDNFATIEHISFDLGDSLNVITGETGAGKSVLVQAISTVLGGRADTSLVRTGSDKAVIQIAGDKNGEEVIISREILANGKSTSKLNGELVTLAKLREFCADFVDIHGQYDNQQILDPDNHITITDSFHADQITPELDKLGALYSEYRTAQKEYEDLLRAEATAKQQKDYYQFEYNYISSLDLVPHEDEELSDQLDVMKNSEKIYSSVNTSYEMIHEADNSVLTCLNRITNELLSVANYSEELTNMSSQIQDIYYQLEDVSGRLRDMSSSLTFSEEDLDNVSSRLSAIEDAKRKYGKSVDEIIIYGRELESKLNMIQNFDYEKNRLSELAHHKYAALEEQAEHVSEIRHIIASRLESAVMSELRDLDFANSDFRINIEKTAEIGPLGYDKVEFLISTNPGEPLMPLTRIASGGEISRIMLAFKHIIGDSDNVETMIFDEIDTGISGRTALVVGKKLKEIAEHHQILCITHLPQIAAYGRNNYLITKDTFAGKSQTEIQHLDADGKVRMVATLFSGSADSGNALEAARELISNTDN